MRGEDAEIPGVIVAQVGSPPHARGKPPFRTRSKGEQRDHPRMRGEDTLAEWARTTGTGSPPHARGRPDPIEKEIGEFGITPACAGKTSATEGRRHAQQDHPRMRGEDRLGGRINFVDVGSPPHARGRRARNTVDYSTPRITPACAGKTSRRQRLATLCADHPRMRGEDPLHVRAVFCAPGSPPHARGRRR